VPQLPINEKGKYKIVWKKLVFPRTITDQIPRVLPGTVRCGPRVLQLDRNGTHIVGPTQILSPHQSLVFSFLSFLPDETRSPTPLFLPAAVDLAHPRHARLLTVPRLRYCLLRASDAGTPGMAKFIASVRRRRGLRELQRHGRRRLLRSACGDSTEGGGAPTSGCWFCSKRRWRLLRPAGGQRPAATGDSACYFRLAALLQPAAAPATFRRRLCCNWQRCLLLSAGGSATTGGGTCYVPSAAVLLKAVALLLPAAGSAASGGVYCIPPATLLAKAGRRLCCKRRRRLLRPASGAATSGRWRCYKRSRRRRA
jgi:hypothetical protein